MSIIFIYPVSDKISNMRLKYNAPQDGARVYGPEHRHSSGTREVQYRLGQRDRDEAELNCCVDLAQQRRCQLHGGVGRVEVTEHRPLKPSHNGQYTIDTCYCVHTLNTVTQCSIHNRHVLLCTHSKHGHTMLNTQ